MGVGGGAKLGAQRMGAEFSHWIPVRYIKKLKARFPETSRLWNKLLSKCQYNGNWVSPHFHYLTDPYRNLRGLKGGYSLPAPFAQLLRTPLPLTGGTVGFGAGAGHMAWGQEDLW